jgi:hypothetical protein
MTELGNYGNQAKQVASQQIGQEINLRTLQDKIRQSQDMVDFGGMNVHRSQVPAMMTAQANAAYKKGQLNDDSYKLMLMESKQKYEALAKEASANKDVKMAGWYQSKIDELDTTLAGKRAIAAKDVQTPGYQPTPAELISAGQSAPDASTGVAGALSATSMNTYIERQILETGILGQIKDPDGIGKLMVNAVVKLANSKIAGGEVNRSVASQAALDDMRYFMAKRKKRIAEGYDKATEDAYFMNAYHFIPKD